MFRLLRAWDAERELSPADFQYILSPRDAFSQARIFYEISSDHYHYPDNISCHDVPRRKSGNLSLFSAPDKRRQRGYADNVYDDTQRNIDEGWIIGIDTHAQWDNRRNPFYFDEDSNLVYDCFMDHYHEWFESEVRKAYEKCLNNHNGRKPAPTVKQAYYGDAPVQHAQAAKTINSKAAGRLLAAGGIYNGNIEGFHDTAQQLGGDAPAGYDQVMDNKGLIIAGASVAAGAMMGRIPVSELEELGKTIPNGATANKNGNLISELKDVTQKQLDKKFKHAIDFGVTSTKKNPETLGYFHDAIKSHMKDTDTFKLGTYGFVKDSNVFFNPNSNSAVVLGESGNFITGFKLDSTSAQYDNYIKNGILR
ncbi:colicin D domain-containing protein [Buttiauxella noackiae]|uniref:colicin D domain-containing protein n=1 Tax=Buttiauxella noackiae TaxID=82992 RepID=UPI0009DFBA4C|nr:colicin D domain-containing protein [Buttiauxella noackiae]